MNNNQIPKQNQNQINQNYYPMPYIPNDPLNFPRPLNTFSIPLSINPSFPPQNSIQSPLFPLMIPDQILYPNNPYFLNTLFNTPSQPNQINPLTQFMMYQNILNDNKALNNNLINNQKNNIINKSNTAIENNIYNKNYLNILEQNNDKEKKENDKYNINQFSKKFFIVHDNIQLEKKNNLNISVEKNKNSENNNIDLNKNNEFININFEQENLLKNNGKNYENKENKENKGKLSLFTISNIKMNTNPNNNQNIQNSQTNVLNNPFIKPENIFFPNNFNNKIDNKNINNNSQFQFLNKKDINKELDNNLNYEINNNNKDDFYNLQQNEIKNEKMKYYRCSYKDCNKVFLKQSNLKDHIRTHTGEKPYICSHPGCGKTFSQHGNLKKHEKIHLGNKKYYCNYPNCGKKFSASYNLKIHYRCHTGEKPYKCNFPNCGRSFYDKGNLKYHEKNMHALENMEFPYSCEHMGCNAKFKTKLEKLKHHSEMETDCFVERKELIKLIQRYKIFFRKILLKKKIDANKNEIVLKLKKNYEEIQNKLIDQELFNHYLGEEFDNECTNIEEISNIDEENNENNENNENKENNENEIDNINNINISNILNENENMKKNEKNIFDKNRESNNEISLNEQK